MKVHNKILIIIIAVISVLLLFNGEVQASSQNWNALNYDVTVNSDGSMDVIETWNIRISKTNTLFKDFILDYSKFSGITNVKVAIIENEMPKYLTQIFEEQYHVDRDCFYALPISNNKFEIAWNVGLDNSSAVRTYKVFYTVNDAVKIYGDCTELYWQFLGKDNEIVGKNITGTIKLPKKVSDIEKLRVWAHGPLSGKIERTSTDTVSFSLPSLDRNTMLEVRIVTEENIYNKCDYIYYENKLDSILSEEKVWADDANAIRDFQKDIIKINVIVFIFFVFLVIKHIKYGKSLKEKYAYPRYDIKYYREIPDEKNATPARALAMYHNNPAFSSYNSSNVFSATLLNLCLKGLIRFELLNSATIEIIIIKGKNDIELTEDEKEIYDILIKAVSGHDRITTDEFSQFSKKEYNYIYKKMNSIDKKVKKYQKDSLKIDQERVELSKKISIKSWIYMFIFFLSLLTSSFIPVIPIMVIICFIIIRINLRRVLIWSEAGYKESLEWKALKKYMEDYSLLKEKSVPDIVLWEKFLVYATTFGISKKVIQQLKVIHPEIFDANDPMIRNNYAYWHIVGNNSYRNNGFDILNSSLNNVYNTAQSAYIIAHSSSSGSGGGFSSGGGGRRWWRPVVEVVKIL